MSRLRKPALMVAGMSSQKVFSRPHIPEAAVALTCGQASVRPSPIAVNWRVSSSSVAAGLASGSCKKHTCVVRGETYPFLQPSAVEPQCTNNPTSDVVSGTSVALPLKGVAL